MLSGSSAWWVTGQREVVELEDADTVDYRYRRRVVKG